MIELPGNGAYDAIIKGEAKRRGNKVKEEGKGRKEEKGEQRKLKRMERNNHPTQAQ